MEWVSGWIIENSDDKRSDNRFSIVFIAHGDTKEVNFSNMVQKAKLSCTRLMCEKDF